MMTTDWMMELEDSRTSGLWFEVNGVGAGELLDFILAKDAEIERLRNKIHTMKENITTAWDALEDGDVAAALLPLAAAQDWLTEAMLEKLESE
jgi:hypothetical protein